MLLGFYLRWSSSATPMLSRLTVGPSLLCSVDDAALQGIAAAVLVLYLAGAVALMFRSLRGPKGLMRTLAFDGGKTAIGDGDRHAGPSRRSIPTVSLQMKELRVP